MAALCLLFILLKNLLKTSGILCGKNDSDELHKDQAETKLVNYGQCAVSTSLRKACAFHLQYWSFSSHGGRDGERAMRDPSWHKYKYFWKWLTAAPPFPGCFQFAQLIVMHQNLVILLIQTVALYLLLSGDSVAWRYTPMIVVHCQANLISNVFSLHLLDIYALDHS